MSFNQSAPTVPTVLNTSNCFVFGNTASGNALSVQQLGSGPVASFSNAAGQVVFSVSATGGITAPGPGGVATNTAIGASALAVNTTGANNTAVGAGALDANTIGANNTAVGKDAMGANTTGQANTAVGKSAMQNNTIGQYNTAVGTSAMLSNTTGANNTAVGQDAMNLNTIGAQNTAVGTSAMLSNTTGANNTAVGFLAMVGNTTGSANTAVGSGAMFTNTTGANNTAVGQAAMYQNTTGSNNTAVGFYAMFANTTGQQNTAIGVNALQNNTTGVNNTALGYQAMYVNTSGTNNVAIGYNSGNDALISLQSGSNFVVLGNNGTSSLYCKTSSITTSSDERDKTDIQGIGIGLDFMKTIRPVKYRWDERYKYPEGQAPDGSLADQNFSVGFIAQELDAAQTAANAEFLDMVDKHNPDRFSIRTGSLVPIMVRAIQDLEARLTALEQLVPAPASQ